MLLGEFFSLYSPLSIIQLSRDLLILLKITTGTQRKQDCACASPYIEWKNSPLDFQHLILLLGSSIFFLLSLTQFYHNLFYILSHIVLIIF